MTPTNKIYRNLLRAILDKGEFITTRNGAVYRSFTLPSITFHTTPLVTVRKTAWRKAIREMEWFLTGDPLCPEELLDWWGGQLNKENKYLAGYGEQLRKFLGTDSEFDQISHLIDGLRSHPFSRRHVITTWNPLDMATITKINNNEKTPTCCHTTIAQFFVSPGNLLSLHSYQRSADMLLGVPHNWIQSWALLLWVAAKTGYVADRLMWTFGDAHVYTEESHIKAANQIVASKETLEDSLRLEYVGNGLFKAADFEMIGKIPSPVTSIRPKML